jgi:hypothetical protein
MLPFTKRPGREESGDVPANESLSGAESPHIEAPRSGHDRPRPFAKSISDEELTTLMPSKSVSVVSRPASVPPPPLSSRPGSGSPASRSVPPPRGKFMHDEDNGRATVRGAPKIVKKKGTGLPTSPTTISPSAVITSTLEGVGRTGRRNDLMAPPPKELLDELAEAHPDDDEPHTVMLGGGSAAFGQPMTPAFGQGYVPPSPSSRSAPPPPISRSMPPPPSSHGHGVHASHAGHGIPSAPHSRSLPPAPHSQSQSGHPYGYGVPMAPHSVSVPGVAMNNGAPSMPAHFMVPQAPHSDARMDPPAFVAPAASAGRSTASWAIALLVIGIGVGLGGIALMRGNDGLRDTTAAFIDPARALQPKAGAAGTPDAPASPAGEAPKPAPVAVGPVVVTPVVAAPVAVAAPVPTDAVAAAPGVLPAIAAPGTPAPVASPVPVPVPVVAFAATAPPAPVAVQAAPAPQPVAYAAPKPTPVAAAPRSTPAPATRPARVASDDGAPVPRKPAGKAGGGKSEIDEETRKALEALQKSQLESSF